ncbi:MAG: condensation domain-containing protein, partial [Pseudomonadota bacterium]
LRLESRLPGYPIYTVPMAFKISGPFDAALFEQSLKAMVYRHEILRTGYKNVQERWTTTPTAAVNTAIEVEDWRIIDASQRDAFVDGMAADDAWTAFDLTRDSPFRIRVLKFAEEEHVLLLTMHHIVMDAWTVRLILTELFSRYHALAEGAAPPLTKPDLQFYDFARWQNQWRDGEAAREQHAFWRGALQGARSVFADAGAARADGANFGTTSAPLHIGSELVGELTAFSRRENGTLFITLLTALKFLLISEFGGEDVSVATPMANRSRPRTEGMVGLIENTAVVRSVIARDTPFRIALNIVRHAVLSAHAHQELPFEALLDALEADGDFDTGPLSELYFSVAGRIEADIDLPGLKVEQVGETLAETQSTLTFNNAKLMFILKESEFGVIGKCVYKDSQFKEAEIEALVDRYEALLERLVADPNLTPWATSRE